MGLLADSIVHGRGLSSPFGPFTGPTAMVAPGYPLLVSLVFRLLGTYSVRSALCLMLFNTASTLATVLLIYSISRRIASERSSFIVGLFWATSLPLLWMPTIFWETNLSALLLLVIVVTTLRWQTDNSILRWILRGGLCGVAGLVNPALLTPAFALAVWAWWHKTSRPRVAAIAFSFTFALVFAPWPLRNIRSLHACVFTRTTLGLELWMGNHSGGEGYLEPSLFPTYNKFELARYKHLGEIQYMDEKERLALAYIHSRPGTFVLLSCKRCFRFWTGSGSRPESTLFFLHASLSLLVALVGLRALWLSGQKDLLMCMLLPLLVFPLPYYITHAEFKYRLIVDPILTILSAGGLDLLSARSPRSVRIATQG